MSKREMTWKGYQEAKHVLLVSDIRSEKESDLKKCYYRNVRLKFLATWILEDVGRLNTRVADSL